MFTGLVEETGEILKVEEGPFLRVYIAARKVLEDLKVGDSVAVDGACLTAVAGWEGLGGSAARGACAEGPRPGGWGTGPAWGGP